MSTFLIEGTTFHSKKSMKASILQATAASSKAFRIVVNRDHRYLVCCASQNAGKGWRKNPFICPWSVECKPTSMHHCTWKIVNIVGNHTCSDEDSNRKRNYHYLARCKSSQVLQTFIPSKKSCGASQQLATMVKATDGLDMKKAKLIVLCKKNPKTGCTFTLDSTS